MGFIMFIIAIFVFAFSLGVGLKGDHYLLSMLCLGASFYILIAVIIHRVFSGIMLMPRFTGTHAHHEISDAEEAGLSSVLDGRELSHVYGGDRHH